VALTTQFRVAVEHVLASWNKVVDMATRTVRVDDLDGTDKDVETVRFAFDGVTYSIDLSSKNKKRFEATLADYINAARRDAGARRAVASSRRSSRSGRGRPSGERSQSVRDWARSNGYAVSERGRISAEIQQAFEEANA
jgi:hypothetical protein